MDKIVILGAGEAGCAAAVSLRTEGFVGSITLVGREGPIPYERPPLSKDMLLIDPLQSRKAISATARFAELDITFLARNEAESINRKNYSVRLMTGQDLAYDRLLLALGSEPRQLPWQSPNLLTLRTHNDAVRLRNRLQAGSRVVVIGGGFIGLECAAAAVARGCDVVIVEAASRILARAVPAEIAEIIADRHRSAGIVLKLGSAIVNISESPTGIAIQLADGEVLSADVAIVGIGAAPAVRLALDAGLVTDNGILVDNLLTTSDPDIFAAGDCASFPHATYNGRVVRLEAWRNAIDQGTLAARNMLGASQPFDIVPWFWSDQFDLNLQIAGLVTPSDTIVLRDLGEGSRMQFHLDETGRLTAACGLGRADRVGREVRLAEMLIARRAHPSVSDLSNSNVKLKYLLSQAS